MTGEYQCLCSATFGDWKELNEHERTDEICHKFFMYKLHEDWNNMLPYLKEKPSYHDYLRKQRELSLLTKHRMTPLTAYHIDKYFEKEEITI